MVADIKAKAETTEVFTGKIEQRQTLCPNAGNLPGKVNFAITVVPHWL